MNTEQKLTKIRQKCVELLAKYPKCESTAGWETTITAIDNALTVFDEILASEIIAAWEGLV